MNYVDIYLCAVPTTNREKYLQLATGTTQMLKEHGALKVIESWGDDVPEGKLTSLPMAVKCEPGEAVTFSCVIWPSRQARDEGMKKFMADPRLAAIDMPYDGKRMIFGGFQTIIEA